MNNIPDKFYLKIGSAQDVKNLRGRIIYRILEIIPGFLTWATFSAIIFGSFFLPRSTVIFIIAFDVYWLLKTAFLTWHLRLSFKIMKKSMAVDWIEELNSLDLSFNSFGIKSWREDLLHLVILPYYIEGYEVIRTTCEGILRTEYMKDKIWVVLSGEERAGEEARLIGERIKREFGSKFGKFIFTIHKDQPGELAGKGANETWAALHAKKELIDSLGIPYEKVLVSVFDIDTVPSSKYFSRLSYLYLTATRPFRTSFQPVPFFINNVWEASAISRVLAFSSTFWHLMNQMRPEQLISFSSHAFPMKALVELNFWQTNVVSEDSRIFWQGYLAFDGDWRVEPFLIPVSMDVNVAENLWRTLKNIYKQQRRWAYGVADVPYMVYGFLKNEKIPLRSKLYWILHRHEGFWSWSTNSIMIFLMGWLPVMLGNAEFGVTVLAYNVPRITRWILTFAMLGIMTSIYLTFRLLPASPVHYGKRKYVFMALQWLLVPITLVFNSFPAIDAQTRLMLGRYMGFWPTPKVRKGIQKEIFANSPQVL